MYLRLLHRILWKGTHGRIRLREQNAAEEEFEEMLNKVHSKEDDKEDEYDAFE